LADEPTGNLDPRLTREIIDLLAAVRDRGTTVLLATHDPLVLGHAALTQQIQLEHGRLVGPTSLAALEDDDDVPAILPAAWPEPAEAVA
ncbi:MAG: AAA family ATPase, partial [Deltaproteobacteria bacterium]|nr:AAA family ATPase [Deltaproteobacteria bacterium]